MDKFDDIWRNKFREETPEPAKWNTPSNSVWEGVELELRKAHRRRVIYYLLLSMVLFIAIMMMIFVLRGNHMISSSQVQIEQKALETTQIFNSVEITSAAIRETESQLSVDITEAKKAANLISEKQVSRPDDDKEIIGHSLRMSPRLATSEINSGSNEKLIFAYEFVKSPDSIFNDKNQETIEHSEMPGRLDFLDLPFREIPIEPIVLNIQDEFIHLERTPEVVRVDKPLFFSYRFAWFSWNQRLSRSFSEDLSPFDFMSGNSNGFSGGVELTWILNAKIALRGGLSMERVKLASSHNADIFYHRIDEHMGDFSNHYTLNLATPYGFAPTDIVLHRLGDINQDEIHMKVDFTSTNKIVNWSLPVLLDFYPLGNQGKWRPVLSFGSAVNYLHSVRTKLNDADTHHERIRYIEKAKESKLESGINPIHFDLRIGGGVSYQLTGRMLISAQYDYARGINAVFRSGNYSTKIDRHIMSISVGYRL